MNSFDPKHFFDSYQNFYNTSVTGASPNRLNNRYLALIENNKGIIENSTILDLASHDGRWSFAALMNKAHKVVGIEGREELVEKSLMNMEKYGVSKEKYSFICADIFQKIKDIPPRSINIVFVFGIFYHIMNHMQLLLDIKRLEPKYLIIDTSIIKSQNPVIWIKSENPQKEAASIMTSNSNKTLVGTPSRTSLELMLQNIGFKFSYYNWHGTGITNWNDLEDYRSYRRISLLASNLNSS